MTESGKNLRAGEALAAAIEAACRGLVYVSETDAPVVPFRAEIGSGEPAAAVIEKLKAEHGGACETVRFDEFFAKLTKDQPWHTPLQTRMVKKYRALKNLLISSLDNLAVYKFGRVRREIFVVGTDKRGDLAGVRTRSVET